MPNYNDSIIGGNPFDYRRFGNIFGGEPAQRQSLLPQNPWLQSINRVQPTAPTQPAPGQDPLLQALQRMQGGQATQAYRQHIGNIPQPEDYAPSKWRRLGSALTAAAGSFGRDPQNAMALGAEVRDAPLKGAVTQWQMKGAGLKEQADLEAQDVQGQIKYLTALREAEKDRRDYELQVGNQEISRFNANITANYRENQNKIAIKRLEQDGWQKMTGPNGNIIMYHPVTKERMDMGPSIETSNLADRRRGLDLEGRRTSAQEAQVGIAGRNAATQETRTGIMQQNANTAASRLGNVGFVSPSAQITADALAVRNVVQNNPGFAQWVDEEGVVIQPTVEDLNNPKYQRFKAAIAAEKNKILSRKQSGMSGMGGPLSFDDLGE